MKLFCNLTEAELLRHAERVEKEGDLKHAAAPRDYRQRKFIDLPADPAKYMPRGYRSKVWIEELDCLIFSRTHRPQAAPFSPAEYPASPHPTAPGDSLQRESNPFPMPERADSRFFTKACR